MSFQTKTIAYHQNLLTILAADLLSDLPGGAAGDLSGGLVLLPSARACRTLGHILLEESGHEALILPRSMTLQQLLEEELVSAGLDASVVPEDSLRQIILARQLEQMPWIEGRQENAPGLAGEFLSFFDELRCYGQEDLLADADAVQRVVAKGSIGEAEVLAQDMTRVTMVWQAYRKVVPIDGVDQLVAASRHNRTSLKAGPELLMVAGFGRMDPVSADLVRGLAARCQASRLYLPEPDPEGAEGALARFFLGTWNSNSESLSPLAPSNLVRRRLLPEADGFESPLLPGTLRQRLDALGETSDFFAPGGPLELIPCADQETESLVVTDKVVQILSQPGGNRQSTAIVTNDPLLANRITAQLRDAGIDVDDTLGQPLSTLPAGLLLRFALRSALNNLRPDALLEVLTHPLTLLAADKVTQERQVLLLEKTFRRQEAHPAGPEALRKLAQERDTIARESFGAEGSPLEDFVSSLLAAFEPLLKLIRGEHPITEFTAALRQTWQLLTPENPLTETRQHADITAADRLLRQIETNAQWWPSTTLSVFVSDFNRLLAAANVPAHRTEGLPVMVAGLVEARLEKFDRLIVAGLNEGKFPARNARPLFLDARTRSRLDLPGWQESLARDADLFLRLLHNAPQVVLTWSKEEEGRPLLPSPWVERLRLGLPADIKLEVVAGTTTWRKDEEPMASIRARQSDFEAEPIAVPVHAEYRRLPSLSWSALSKWRDCPYRFLLERGFRLRKEEEVQEEFGRKDTGTIIHKIMQRFLQPSGEGFAALAAGHTEKAAAHLSLLAQEEFAPEQNTLPGRRLWLGNFVRWIPELVDLEVERFRIMRPYLLEAEFKLSLAEMVGWLEKEVARGTAQVEVPELTEQQQQIELTGAIDRVDMATGGGGMGQVIDFKTGTIPAPTQVQGLVEMQLLLYSLACEAGRYEQRPAEIQIQEAFYYAIKDEGLGCPKGPHFNGDRQLLAEAACELIQLSCLADQEAGPFGLLPRERAGVGPSNLPCRYCDFRGSCRLEERAGWDPATEVKIDKVARPFTL